MCVAHAHVTLLRELSCIWATYVAADAFLAAGLGWVAVGVDGDASFRAWAPPGIAVTTRDALMPKYAEVFQRPGLGMRDKGKLPKAAKKATAVPA